MGKLLIAYFHMAETRNYWKSHVREILWLFWDFQTKDI